jgi:hypothetical protein
MKKTIVSTKVRLKRGGLRFVMATWQYWFPQGPSNVDLMGQFHAPDARLSRLGVPIVVLICFGGRQGEKQ